MEIDALSFERLAPEQKFTSFDCGDEDLNDFLLTDAQNYQKSLLAFTYLVKDSDDVIGYFSLLNDKLSFIESSKKSWRRIKGLFPHSKHRRDYPAVKVGRLAVSSRYQGTDIGTRIMDFVKYSFIDRNRTGCVFITVDALRKSMPFYVKNKFKVMDEEQLLSDSKTIQMYYDLKQLI